jgi:membrane protein implicated in regulation of membrane protease activity
MEIFENLDPLLRTFWYIAIPVSLIFVVQTIMTFVGADATDGNEVDFDGDFAGGDAPFQLFSLRNLINFLLGFGWSGISLFNVIPNPTLLIVVSIVIGILFVLVFFVIIRQVQRLAEDNSFKMENTLNKTADVYLSIPEHKTGKGKILISVKGSIHELDAMTESERIPTGSVVKVVKIENNNILIVETI